MKRIALGAGLLLLLAVATGCGRGQGKVTGRVLYNGKPLPGGHLMFRPADPRANSVTAELDEQGNYEAVLPVGEVKVSIDNRDLEPRAPQMKGVPLDLPLSAEAKKAFAKAKPDKSPPQTPVNAPAKPAGKYVQIPERYHDSEKSGLQFKVEGGDQKHDIELTR